MQMRTLKHEVWSYQPPEGDRATSLCLAGPMGDDLRRLLGPTARLITTIEAASHFEAMTEYYKLMGWGAYTAKYAWDLEPYPHDWFQIQSTDR